MLLPNADRAFIDPHKIADYLLDPTHPVGQHKARVFSRALGLAKEDAAVLYAWLFRAAQERDATAGESDEFGQRYNVDLPVTTEMGSAWLRSAWIILKQEDFPRFVTCFVLPK